MDNVVSRFRIIGGLKDTMAKEYNISKTDGRCSVCEKQLQSGDQYVATVIDAGEELQRVDFCLQCWEKDPREDTPDLLGVWHTQVPKPQEKKKLLVDNDLLINFFERLDGADEPAKVNFRFVLALILMRKKLLVYDRSEKKDDGTELWSMHFKGSDQKHEVTDPHMDEEKIAQVSQQLGQIMEGEL